MFKRYLPTSLLGRTILIILIPLLLLQIAVSIVFFDRHWSKMTERLSFAVAGEMAGALQAFRNNPAALDDINKLLNDTVQLEMFFMPEETVLPANRESVGSNRLGFRVEDSIDTDLAEEIESLIDYPFQITVQENRKTIIVDFLMTDGVITFFIPERRLFSSSSYIFLLWVIGLSILLFTIAIVFMRNQIRPIYRLSLSAERLGRGIPVGKIKPSGSREVRRAAEAFIQMQDRINQFVEQRTTMLAAVSHDLRTPLTRLKLQLEMIEDGPDKQAIQSDIKDMEQMIEGYLAFAKGDEGEEIQRLSTHDMFERIINDAERMGLAVKSNISDDSAALGGKTYIWVRPRALKRVFDNILSNAERYADTVALSYAFYNYDDANFVDFCIEDNGEGVSSNLMDDLIKPFYRVEGSRNKKTGGVGLGLAIANDIIVAHGGRLEFHESRGLGGLKVIISLPI